MSGALFMLGNGRTVVSQHYRLDETKFPGLPGRRPPGMVAYASGGPADDPYSPDFVPPGQGVPYASEPCTYSTGNVDGSGWAVVPTAMPDLLCFHVRHTERRVQTAAERSLTYDATVRELDNLISIGTFEAYPHATLPPGSRSVPGMHVLKRTPDGALKLNAKGKAKDRLCMRGDMCPRVPGVPTYSPCVEWPVFLIFCVVAVAYKATILQLDVVNAFVQAKLADHLAIPPTYMPGFGGGHKYVRVLHALYGLPESSCLFHTHLDGILRGQSFRLLGGEPCMYVRCFVGGPFVLIVLHVYDFMMSNCGCTGSVFEGVWRGIRDALNGYLKTAEPREFLGTDVSLVSVGAARGGTDGADAGGLDFWRGNTISGPASYIVAYSRLRRN
jgi:hypothetical protein